MIDQRLYEEFRDVGRDIYVGGMTSTHGGNLSVRVGKNIIIKRRGAQLGRLKPSDFVVTVLYGEDSGVTRASSELIVHRAIYQQTNALAIVHCHPPTAVAISLTRDEIIPVDNECSYILHRVPVVAAELSSGSPEMAKIISEELRSYKLIMMRGHGVFSIGQTLDEALQWTSAFEMGCKILYKLETLSGQHIEFRKQAGAYSTW
jgi:L-fuculose-phosphate aldolase